MRNNEEGGGKISVVVEEKGEEGWERKRCNLKREEEEVEEEGAREMTLEVFNEPWHYCRAQGEGGEGRQTERGGGGRVGGWGRQRRWEGGRCGAI